MAVPGRAEVGDSSKFFSATIESAIDAIAIIDQKGIIQLVNPAVTRLFGYNQNELKGRNVSILMPRHHADQHDTYVHNYLTTGDAKIIGIGREVRGKHKDGHTFPIRLAVSEVKDKGKSYFVGFMQDLTKIKEAESAILRLNEELEHMVAARTEELSDAVNTLLEINKKLEHEITERQSAERELRASRRELEDALEKEKELNELKSRFVSMASHEFRTPLSTILSSTALIGRYTESDQQEKRDKHLSRIKSAVTSLNAILNDFLSISKIEEGKVLVAPNDLAIDALFEEIAGDTEGLLKQGQRLTCDHRPEGAIIRTDKHVLKNILFNLISNAIKYSDEGTTIRCRSRLEDDTLEFSIADEGMGIPAYDQKHLFTRFFRASNATNIQGTGLGLNIVKGYVDMLNGTIDFTSEEGKGSTFTVTIPSNRPTDG